MNRCYYVSVFQMLIIPVMLYDMFQNYCSNKCYSASKYLQQQIPSEPVWLREKSRPEPIKFLSEEDNKYAS